MVFNSLTFVVFFACVLVLVLFVRMPSDWPFLDIENSEFSRAKTSDALLTAAGASGIHYEDYPEMQGLELPEWSHLSRADAERFTEARMALNHMGN